MPRHPDGAAILSRLRPARRGTYGDGGVPRLTRDLGLAAGTWLSYEAGAAIPGEVLLGFVRLTAVRPRRLLTGEGPAFARPGRGTGRGRQG